MAKGGSRIAFLSLSCIALILTFIILVSAENESSQENLNSINNKYFVPPYSNLETYSISPITTGLTLYEYYHFTEGTTAGASQILKRAQVFTIGGEQFGEDFILKGISLFFIYSAGNYSLTVALYNVSNGKPDTELVRNDNLRSWQSGPGIVFYSLPDYKLKNDTQYAIVFYTDSGSTDSYRVKSKVYGEYTGGSSYYSSNFDWIVASPNEQLWFEVWGVKSVEEDNLTQRVELLEQQVANLTQEARELKNKNQEQDERISFIESLISAIQSTIDELTNKIEGYLTYLPVGFKEKMLCGYLEKNNETTNIEGLGLHCEIFNQKCVCNEI